MESAKWKARRVWRPGMAVSAGLVTGAATSGMLWSIGAQAPAFGIAVLTIGASIAIAVFLVGKRLRSDFHAAASDARENGNRLAVATALEIRSTAAIAGQFPAIFMPQSGFSMTSSNLVGLLDLLVTLRPKTVVELGSGFSTILIAAWLKREGDGRLVSFDHEPYWAEKCRAYLRLQSLDPYADVRDAPLGSRQIGSETFLWYSLESRIGDIQGIDLLVVDGPPSRRGQSTRWPALPVFHDRLSKDAAIFVDDGNRPAERAMVEAWMNEFKEMSSHYTSTLTGYWIVRRCSLGGVGVGDG